MIANKIRISNSATHKLRQLKGRTGLTPNILARLGFCLSLNDPSIPNPKEYEEDGQEFNRYTLTGEWDTFFIAMIKERCKLDGLNLEKDVALQFRAHLNRGVLQLCGRVKGLEDLDKLLPQENSEIVKENRDS